MSISKSIAAALLAIVVVMVLQALYSVKLNRDFYEVHAPFLDSCAYTNQLADYACVVVREGYGMGLQQSLAGNVALPWLEMTALAKIVTPSRALGVWFQAVWLALLALSVYWYLVRYRAAPVWLGFCLTLPFVSFSQIYYFNGGLHDFRMDLSLYIFTSLCAVWFLATYETQSKIPWLLAGIAAMLACLARATAPVYLISMLSPLLAIRFWNSRGRRKELVLGCVWMGAPVLLSTGAYLIHNYHNLYFYYVTWSPDANAHLPLSQSYPHLVMAFWHIGDEMVACGFAALAINIAMAIAATGLRARGLWRGIQQIDWKILWLGFASPLFLFFRGAGMNAFVTMPAVFGCLLFAYFPFRGIQPLFRGTIACLLVGALAVGSSIYNASHPNTPRPHKGQTDTIMAGFKSVIEQMSDDASARGLQKAVFVAPESGAFNCLALTNVMIYEFGAICDRKGRIEEGGCGDPRTLRSGVTLQFRHYLEFIPTDELLWKLNVPGRTDPEKMENLFSTAMKSDYLLLPDEPTLGWLEKNMGYNFINLKTRELKTRLLGTGAWVQLGHPAAASPNETIEVYARRSR
jgi:hypothetical protein